MPYWVHGRDAETGQPTEPIFSEADNEADARAEAAAQDMIVDSVKPHVQDDGDSGSLPVGDSLLDPNNQFYPTEPQNEARTHSEPGRPWYQFSLRSFLLFVTAICILLGCVMWFVRPRLEFQRAAAPFREAGGWVQGSDYLGADGIRAVGFSRPTFSGPELTDAKLKELIEPLRDLPNLEFLNLDGTQITDDGLAHLGEFVQLKSLGLTKTPITDSGLAHLKPLVNLEYLGLWGTQVTDDGLQHLSCLTKLQRLDLLDTQTTREGIYELLRTLPDCKIHKKLED